MYLLGIARTPLRWNLAVDWPSPPDWASIGASANGPMTIASSVNVARYLFIVPPRPEPHSCSCQGRPWRRNPRGAEAPALHAAHFVERGLQPPLTRGQGRSLRIPNTREFW